MTRARWVLAGCLVTIAAAGAVAWLAGRGQEDPHQRAQPPVPPRPPVRTGPAPPAPAREWGLTFLHAAPESDAGALDLVRGLIAGNRADGAATGITSTRTIVPWDIALPPDPALGAAQSPPDLLPQLDRWVTVMRGLGLRPMVSFEHSRSGGYDKDRPSTNPLPTPAQYRAAMTAFLDHYAAHGAGSWDYTAWNEPNLVTQPTEQARVRPATWPAVSPDAPAVASRWHFGAAMAVRYVRELRGLCAAGGRSCRVLPGDFSGVHDFSWDASDWYRTYRHFTDDGERLWAWHDYGDVRAGSTADLRAFMDAVPGAQVWITEVGPLFSRGDKAVDAAALTRDWAAYVAGLQRPPVWDRLHGLTYYMLYGDANWDSGLISKEGVFRADVYAPLVALSARR